MKINGKNIERLVQLNNHKNKQITPEKNIENNKISDLPNVYYNPVSFGRSWTEHKSWGGVIDPKTKEASFKIFTFPDVKKVTVTIQKANKSNTSTDQPEEKEYELESKGGGIFETKKRLSPKEAEHGDKYYYTLYRANGDIEKVKDPYSFKQESILGASTLYDHSLFEWNDSDWFKNNKQRLSRQANAKNGLTPINKARIYEFNTATITNEGNFDSAKTALKEIKDMGFNAIEIMPVENTYSFNWGYDGVDKHAPSEYLGGPDKLKGLIDYAHSIGLNVIMDMVPNHIGPDGDSLTKAGPYESGAGEFGGELNYEGIDNRYVRDWMTNAALWWANEFKVDGIRFDMTKHCKSDYFLKQIVAEVNEHNPDVFLIAEDGRENFDKVTQYNRFEMTHDNELAMIDQGVDNIAQRRFNSDPGEIGFDSEWDFPFMHDIKDALLTPSPILLGKLDWKIRNSAYRVKYTMSHDEIGNEDGTRFIPKVITRELDLFLKVNGSSDAQKGQRAAKVSQALAELAVSEKLDEMSEEELTEYEKSIGLQEFIPKDKIQTAFEIAIAKQKLGLGTVFTIPGIKMFFQGDDEADLSNFKFFREFSDEKQQREQDYDYARRIIHQKGYDTLFAKDSSMLGRVPENPKYKKIKTSIQNFCSEMTKLLKEHPALRVGDIVETFQDNYNNVHTHHLKKDDEEFLILKNFGQAFHSDSYYYVNFPQGEWKEVLNSDSTKFGGGGFTNEDKVITKNNQGINMAPNSIVILKKI